MGLLDASAGRETDCDPTGVGDTGSAEDRGADALGVRVSLADPDTLTADDTEGGTLVLGVDTELGVPLGLSVGLGVCVVLGVDVELELPTWSKTHSPCYSKLYQFSRRFKAGAPKAR